MLKPYIAEKGCLKFIGKCVKDVDSGALQDKISALFGEMNEIFASVEEPVDEKFYGISACHVNGSSDSVRSYWLCKEVARLKREDGTWVQLRAGTEALVIPASRWLYIPVRYDDPFVTELAPPEYKEDYSYLTVCVFVWARKWLKENGYEEQDFPFELEIYGLYDGYGESGANITLALPIK